MMDSVRHDLRHALRSLRQSRGFTVVALLTLALGIGANTAIFTVVKSVLLEPLPYPEPEQLVVVLESNLDRGYPQFTVSPPNFHDLQEQNQVFSAMAAYSGASIALTGDGHPERLRARRVSGEYFRVNGSEPLYGRVIGSADDRPGAPPVVVLGHGFWQRRFAGDTAVIGRALELDGTPTTVIGIMPDHFSSASDIYVPLGLDYTPDSRGSHWLICLARLAPGVTLQQARDNLQAITAGLEEAYPDTNAGWSTVVDPLRELVVAGVRPALLLLTLAVGLVLLIACANVAGLALLLAAIGIYGLISYTVTSRLREIGVRLALGAERGTILWLVLGQGMAPVLAGAVLGIGAALAATRLLASLVFAVSPADPLTFAAVTSLLLAIAILACLLPAWRATRVEPIVVLREE